MLEAACKDLRLEGIALRWFREETPEEAREREEWGRELLVRMAAEKGIAEDAALANTPPETLEAAGRVATFEREQEAGEVVRITSEGECGGQFLHRRPNEVWVLAGRAPADTARTLAHELRHLKRHQQFGTKLESTQGVTEDNFREKNRTLHDYFEGDCERYAADALRRLDWRPA